MIQVQLLGSIYSHSELATELSTGPTSILFNIYSSLSGHFGFDDRILVLIVPVPVHCLIYLLLLYKNYHLLKTNPVQSLTFKCKEP